jgi:hypothetical protein
MQWFKKWLRPSTPGSPKTSRRRGCTTRKSSRGTVRLGLEELESRTVPTVVFNPVFGAETIFQRDANGNPTIVNGVLQNVITGPISNNPTVLNNPTVYIIFWGANWTQAIAAPLAKDAQTIINSNYLSGLRQYGSDGTAVYGNYFIDNTPDPPAGGGPRDGEVQNILNGVDSKGNPLANPPSWKKPTALAPNPTGSNLGAPGYLQSPIYVVVYDNGAGGGNGGGLYTAKNGSTYLTNGFWIGDGGTTTDGFTNTFSHELVERISDGTGAGIGMNAPINITGEYQNSQIADNEPNGGNYTNRLNGSILVQAYWSIIDQAFIIPDGNAKKAFLDPIWNGLTFTSHYNLLIDGGAYDTITVNASDAQVLVDFDGESFLLDGGQINGITIDAGGGTNTIDVQSLAANQTLTINSSTGQDTIGLGTAPKALVSDLSPIEGIVTIAGNGQTNLAFFDQSDSAGMTYQLDSSFFAFAETGFTETGIVVYSGLAKFVLNGSDNPSIFNVESTHPGTTYRLNGGLGDDTLNVCPVLQNCDGLGSSLTVNGGGGTDSLIINDQNASAGQTYDLTSQFLDFRTGRSITYSALAALVLNGSNVGSTYNVETTAALTASTLNGGVGNDTFNVCPLLENCDELAGLLTVSGGGGTDSITVNDQAAGRALRSYTTDYTVSTGGLTRSIRGGAQRNPPVITIDYSGFQSLQLNVGKDTNNVDVEGIVPQTTIQAGAGFTTVNLGPTSKDLDWLTSNALTILGAGTTTLNVDDQSNTAAATYSLNATVLYVRPFSQGITYLGVTTLVLNGGQGGNTDNIYSTAAGTASTINGGTGGATFNVGNFSNSLDDIRGALTVNGQGGEETMNFNDQGNVAATTYALTSTTLARTHAATITYSFASGDPSPGVLKVNGGSGGTGDVMNVLGTSNNDVQYYLTGGGNGNQINVVGTSLASFVVIEGGIGTGNLIRVGSLSQGPGDLAAHGGTLANCVGSVYPYDGSGSDNLVIDDSGDKAAHPNVTLIFFSPPTAGELVGMGPFILFTVPTLNSFTLYGGSGATAYTVSEVSNNFSAATLYTGTGKDSVNVNVDALSGHGLTVHGQGRTDVLNLSDEPITDAATYAVTSTSVIRTTLTAVQNLAPEVFTLNYDGLTSLAINGGSAANTFDVQGTAPRTAYTINGGTGGATFNVGNISNSLDGIKGALSVNGQGGAYTLNVNDQGNADAATYTMTGTALARTGAATITYSGLTYAQSAIYVNTGSEGTGDVIDVDGTVGSHAFIWINGGGNGNQINVLGSSLDSFLVCEGGAGSNNLIRFGSISYGPGDLAAHRGSLAKIQGGVYGFDDSEDHAGNFNLVIDDSADKVAYPNVNLGNTLLTGFGPAAYFYWENVGLSSFTLYGGTGASVYNISSLPAYFSAETVSTGTGNDVVNISEPDYYTEGMTLHGQGNTVLNINDQTITDATTYTVTSTSVTRTTLTAVQNFTPEVFTLKYDGLTALAINGGGAANTFDLQSMAFGTAYTFNGGTGGSAPNVGNANNSNALIAGANAGKLIGRTDEDLLVGGTTNYDPNLAALDAIMAEWDDRTTACAGQVNDLLNAGRNVATGGPELSLYYVIMALDTCDWNAALGEVFI